MCIDRQVISEMTHIKRAYVSIMCRYMCSRVVSEMARSNDQQHLEASLLRNSVKHSLAGRVFDCHRMGRQKEFSNTAQLHSEDMQRQDTMETSVERAQ